MPDATLQTLTGTPREETVNGKPVKFYPLTMSDVAEWDAWAQRAFLCAAALDRFNISTTNEEWAAQLEHRRLTEGAARRICLGNGAAESQMFSGAGMMQAVWLSMRHGDSALTPAQVEAALAGANTMATLRNLRLAAKAVYLVSGFIEEVERKPGDGPLAPPQFRVVTVAG